jgi:hypothetical protein
VQELDVADSSQEAPLLLVHDGHVVVPAQARQSRGVRPAFLSVSDQVIRENPASRGTETSAEVLVGPPWRMESNAG